MTVMTEITGLSVEVTFDLEKLKLAVLKKLLAGGDLNIDDLRKLFTENLLDGDFLRLEMFLVLSRLEEEGVVISELKPYSGTALRRCFRVNSSNQTVNKEEPE